MPWREIAFWIAALAALGGIPAIQDMVVSRSLEGPARVIDGDSLELGGHRVRLHGIDAPELGQRCDDRAGRPFACGERARESLRQLVGDATIRCARRGTDRFQRVLAACRLPDGSDLGTAMVRSGWAVAYPGDGSAIYRAAETDAARRRAGLWAGGFDRPEAWRRDHPPR